jgi:hypothetical protein
MSFAGRQVRWGSNKIRRLTISHARAGYRIPMFIAGLNAGADRRSAQRISRAQPQRYPIPAVPADAAEDKDQGRIGTS